MSANGGHADGQLAGHLFGGHAPRHHLGHLPLPETGTTPK